MAAIAALVLALFTPLTPYAAAQVPMGPWLDRIVWSEQLDRSLALTQIIAGDQDTIIFDITAIADKERALASDQIHRFSAFGLFDNFLMNPSKQDPTNPRYAENPFAIDAVRASMQLLIDREFITREIWGGFAIARGGVNFHPKSPDYGRGIADFLQLEEKWSFDPQAGKEMMFTALEDAGWSIGTDNLWHDSQGNLVTIVGQIRTQDERLQMGAYYANIFRGLNFKVEENRGPLVSSFAYGGAPDQNLWNFYTAGWISTAIAAWDDGDQFFWTCGFGFEPYCEHRPGDNVNDNVYTVNQELADLGEQLFLGQYATLTERQTMMARAAELMMDAPVRVFVDARESLFVFNNRFQDGVVDLFGGPSNPWFLKTATVPVEPAGAPFAGERVARVMNLVMFVDGWNPWQAAPGWLYDTVQRRAMTDLGMWLHPHTGRWIDIRSQATVDTAGPDDSLPVASSAMTFRTSDNTWQNVAMGTTATSKVTLDFVMGNWHTGEPITMADQMAEIAVGYRRSMPDGDIALLPGITNAASGAEELFFQQQLVGVDIIDEDTMDVYIDFWHVDDQEIAAVGSGFANLPWEGMELGLQTIIDGDTANNEEDAKSLDRPWLDLTKGDSLDFLAAALTTLMAENAGSGHIPPGMDSALLPAFARIEGDQSARWNAFDAFATAKGHYWPSQGPFVLDKVDQPNKQTIMVANRDYVWPADFWDALIVVAVPTVTFAPTAPVVFAGTPAVFDFSVSVGPAPTDDFTSVFFLRDVNTGEFMSEGTPSRLGTGSYRIEIPSTQTQTLLLGNFEIISIVSGATAAPPVITRNPFLILPSTDFFINLLDARATLLEGDIDKLAADISTTNTNLVSNTAATEGLAALLTVVVILAVIAIAVAVVSVVLVLRRPGGK